MKGEWGEGGDGGDGGADGGDGGADGGVGGDGGADGQTISKFDFRSFIFSKFDSRTSAGAGGRAIAMTMKMTMTSMTHSKHAPITLSGADSTRNTVTLNWATDHFQRRSTADKSLVGDQ